MVGEPGLASLRGETAAETSIMKRTREMSTPGKRNSKCKGPEVEPSVGI